MIVTLDGTPIDPGAVAAKAGFDKVSSDLQAVAIGFTNLVATMIAMTVIDRLGRKKMLLAGAVGTAASLAGVAWIFASKANEHLLVWLLNLKVLMLFLPPSTRTSVFVLL